MNPELYNRAALLFGEVCDLSRDERERVLDDRCAGDPGLREAVERLLSHDTDPSSLVGDAFDGAGAVVLAGALDEPPAEIGRYQVRGVLGEGGFGVVYAAHQAEPIARDVAIKVIKPGMDSRRVVRRFEAERQTLAMLDHPGVARIYDAGVTGDARPYFVMEKIDGRRVTAHCDHERLSVDQRLELFCAVCDAVEHAHQKGVIHRDLKPSNILVTRRDGTDQVKVIDFGIARALASDESDRTQMTGEGQPIGTPEYMSPEQAAGSPDLDTRADVYALGMVLYELLVGSSAFDRRPGTATLPPERTPPRPSTRVGSRAPDAATRAADRRTQPAALAKRLRGDIDRVVLKALEPDRERRYASVSALADDIRHVLRREPVSARPRSAAYVLTRFAQRRPGLAASLVLAVLSIGGGTSATAWQAMRASRAEARATAALAEARAERDRARAVSAFLIEDLLKAPNPGIDGRQVRVVDVLERAERSIERDLAEVPDLRAVILLTLAEGYQSLGVLDRAGPSTAKALELTAAQFGASSSEHIRARLNEGRIRSDQGRLEDGRTLLASVHADAEEALGRGAELTIAAASSYGSALWQLGRSEQAIGVLRPAWEDAREMLGPAHRQTIEIQAQYAMALEVSPADRQEAERVLRDAIDMHVTHAGPEDPMAAYLTSVLGGNVLSQGGRFAEAETVLRRALDRIAAAFGPDHVNTLVTRNNLAQSLAYQQRWDEAAEVFEDLLARTERVLGPEHPNALGQRSNLASVYGNAGRAELALETLRPAYEAAQRSMGEDRIERWDLALHLGSLIAINGRPAEAEPLIAEGFERFHALRGAFDWDCANHLAMLVRCRLDAGLEAPARAALDRFGHYLTQPDLRASDIGRLLAEVDAEVRAAEDRAVDDRAADDREPDRP